MFLPRVVPDIDSMLEAEVYCRVYASNVLLNGLATISSYNLVSMALER